MSHFIIIANGPFLVREVIIDAIQNKTIVALDGAANKLYRMTITPHIILGDFDSIDKETQQYWGIKALYSEITPASRPYYGNHGVCIVPAKDQNETDLVKAIHYCDKQGAKSISIICATGGREDHYESIKQALQTEYRSNRVITIHTEQQSLRCARDEVVLFEGVIGDHCGMIGINGGLCSSTGLEYECDLERISVCNLLKTPTAVIQIKGLALLIMPPELPSQRVFLKMSEVARLELQLRDAMKTMHT